jgi:uncharacterized membrane protein required for colicin V production
MLGFFTILMMLGVAYAYLREGLLTAFAMLINVLIAGTVAFNFFEPLASMMEPTLSNTFFAGYEDMVCLIAIFALTLGILRTIVNTISASMVQYPGPLQRPGGAIMGLAVGYFTAGFLVCALQTLPWHQNFMSFDWEVKSTPEPLRRVLPPDRVWLALMHRAGAYPFSSEEEPKGKESNSLYDKYKTFDPEGLFELNYARYRRYNDQGVTLTPGD